MTRCSLNLFLLIAISVFYSYCTYDHTLPVCGADQNRSISYRSDVMPILAAQCLQCHDTKSRSGGVVLDTYEKVKLYADAGELYNTVSYAAGYLPMMPKGGKLSDCDILIIKKWAEEKSPDN